VVIGDSDIGTGGRVENGQALVWYGPLSGAYTAGSADVLLVATANRARFGASLTMLGDVDGDGDDELVVGAPRSGVAGRVFVYQGGTLPSFLTTANADTVLEGQPYAWLGYLVQPAGDVDRDGISDLWAVSDLTDVYYENYRESHPPRDVPNRLIATP
jgi:hypothetical protein